jgi:antitoxin Phd
VKTVQLRDAKANLSALVEDAERGEPSIITKHGRPAAVLMPMEQAEKFFAAQKPSLAEYLLNAPEHPEYERDQTPLPSVDF